MTVQPRAAELEVAFLAVHGDAGPVARALMDAGQGVEQRGLAAVGIARDADDQAASGQAVEAEGQPVSQAQPMSAARPPPATDRAISLPSATRAAPTATTRPRPRRCTYGETATRMQPEAEQPVAQVARPGDAGDARVPAGRQLAPGWMPAFGGRRLVSTLMSGQHRVLRTIRI